METQATEFTIKDIGPLFARRKWVVIACLLLCIVVSWIITIRSPKIYAASSKLLFNRPSYAILLSDTSPTAPTVEDKATQVYLLQSSEVSKRAEQILQKEQVDISAQQIAGALKVSDVENTDVIVLTAEHSDPTLCAKIANAAAGAFVEYKRFVRKENVHTGIDTLNSQLKASEKSLLRAERELATFKRTQGIIDVKKQGEGLILRIQSLQTEVALNTPVLEEARNRSRVLAQQMKQQTQALATGNIRNDAVISQLWEKLSAKELEILTAEQKYTDKFPGMLQPLRAERNKLQERLRSEIRNIVTVQSGSPELQSKIAEDYAKAQLEEIAVDAKLRVQNRLLSETNTKLRELPDKESIIQRLTRQVTVAEQIYTGLLVNLEKAQVDRTRQNDTVVVAEYASAPNPKKPLRPVPLRNLLLGAVVGAAIGIFGAFLLEYLDDAIRSSEEVRRYLDLPVLGQIPSVPEGLRLITELHPKSPVAEAYRTLRSNISFVTIDEPIRTLVVTSSSIAEGKSVTTANLSLTMALEGKRVLLADADLRHPAQQELFGLEERKGLTDVLMREAVLEDVIVPVPGTTLAILPCGSLPPNPSELLASEQMGNTLRDLLDSWDIVVFDTPPCTLVADAVILASRCDGSLQVIDAETAGRQSAMDAADALRTARARILGVVLNRVGTGKGRRYYYYHYEDYPRSQLARPAFLRDRSSNNAGEPS